MYNKSIKNWFVLGEFAGEVAFKELGDVETYNQFQTVSE